MKQLIDLDEGGGEKPPANRVTWLDAPPWVSRTGFWLSMFLVAVAGLLTYFGGNRWAVLFMLFFAAVPFSMIGADAAWTAVKNRQTKTPR